MRRWIYRLLAAPVGVIAMLSAATAETPLVPIVSSFHHWDHHWYIWLPGDPVYEAVEVMSRDRGPGAPPLVWVFFTERDGVKRQVHYFNDRRVAMAIGGQYRDIAFAMNETEGHAWSVAVALSDMNARHVAIDVQFSPYTQLVSQGAGLTNQIGHSGDRLLLVFYREKNAFASNWQVTVSGVNVAEPQPGQNHTAPFPAAYSSNIFVATFPFADRRVVFDAGPAEPDLTRFTQTASQDVLSANLIDGTRLELITTGDGRLRQYRHVDGSHMLEVSFEPPMPSTDGPMADVDSTYRISLDGFRDLIVGTVHVAQRNRAVVLDWNAETPDWVRMRPLQTTVIFKSNADALIALRPAPGQ